MNETRDYTDPIAAARRFLEDLELFEGRSFLVSGASAEAAQEKVPVPAVDEAAISAPLADMADAKDGELQRPIDAANEPVVAANEPVVAANEPVVAANEPEVAANEPEVAHVAASAEVREDGGTGSESDSPIEHDSAFAEAGPTGGELELFRGQICACQNCRLGETRGHFVFGAGRADADIMFVGEAPGADEDRSGQPFVGAAGQLLDKIIEAMGLAREEVYICNILKCRPPNNRDPQPDEIEQCEPYLKRQIELIQPRVICTLGRFAAQTLLRSDQSMGRLRQQEHRYQGIPLIATYHPAALLRNAQWKRPTWEDIKKVRRLYDGVEL